MISRSSGEVPHTLIYDSTALSEMAKTKEKLNFFVHSICILAKNYMNQKSSPKIFPLIMTSSQAICQHNPNWLSFCRGRKYLLWTKKQFSKEGNGNRPRRFCIILTGWVSKKTTLLVEEAREGIGRTHERKYAGVTTFLLMLYYIFKK